MVKNKTHNMKKDLYGPIDGRTLEKDRTEKSLTV